ncbi:MAG: sigma 54-interacting transcriptional regulator, partial [Desulfobacteraceae bacterium]|nr:sigma 54-interacting transcriptional regulator [Desulfobacteraceae bacterium]
LRYRTIADFTYDWETWEDPDGSYNYVSPSFERITGYASQQLVKNPELINEIILPDDLNLWEEHHQTIHARHEAAEILFRIRAKDGKIRWIEHICQPVFNDKGEYLGVRASNRDITKRKQSEIKLRNALKEIELLKDQLQAESAYLQDEIKLEHNFENIIGHSDALKYVLYRVAEVAPTDVPILIMGETGTGKELIARAIHNLSSRNKRALLKLNCAALPASVIESELFGHEKGAYTGANIRRVGRFQMADGATLFLDEISEIPLELQSKLLQVLQDGEFEPLGSSKTLSVDVRIIAASNRDLEDEVNHGRFRRDLFYRINVFPFTVPPLRNRKEDIPLLVKWFVDMFNRKMDKNITSIPKELIRHLQAYDWPGNVRELENVIERAVITSKGSILKLTDNLVISAKVRSRAKLKETLTEVERTQILNTLENTGWKIEGVNGAAGVLGLAPSTLRDRIKKLGIRHPMK